MAKFKVFHAKRNPDGGTFGRFGFESTTFPEHYEFVAEVEADALGQVFELTNHIYSDWTKNDGVKATAGPKRSTSVGDIIMSPSSYFVIAPVGLRPIFLDENFQAQIPSLYEGGL